MIWERETMQPEVITEADGRYSVVLKFSLDVSEYLKGIGPSSIVAVWVDGRSYDTRDEANDAKDDIFAERDNQWDDREAIIFLLDGFSGFGTLLDGQLQLADHFLLSVGDPYSPDDFYSLHSRVNKVWLPAPSSGGSTGDGQKFLLDLPPPPGSGSIAPTITLGDLKTRITDVIAELDGGDGSEAYDVCVKEKYRFERTIRYFREVEGRDAMTRAPSTATLRPVNPPTLHCIKGRMAASIQVKRRGRGSKAGIPPCSPWYRTNPLLSTLTEMGDSLPVQMELSSPRRSRLCAHFRPAGTRSTARKFGPGICLATMFSATRGH